MFGLPLNPQASEHILGSQAEWRGCFPGMRDGQSMRTLSVQPFVQVWTSPAGFPLQERMELSSSVCLAMNGRCGSASPVLMSTSSPVLGKLVDPRLCRGCSCTYHPQLHRLSSWRTAGVPKYVTCRVGILSLAEVHALRCKFFNSLHGSALKLLPRLAAPAAARRQGVAVRAAVSAPPWPDVLGKWLGARRVRRRGALAPS